MTYEEKIKRLEQIIAELESGEIGVEKSLELFKEATVLTSEAYKTIQDGKVKIFEIKKSLNEIEETPIKFNPNEE